MTKHKPKKFMFGRIKSFVPKNFAFQTVLAALLVQALRTLGQKM